MTPSRILGILAPSAIWNVVQYNCSSCRFEQKINNGGTFQDEHLYTYIKAIASAADLPGVNQREDESARASER